MRSHNDSDNIYTWSGPIQKLSGIILATYPGTSVPIWLLSICDKYSTSYQLHRHWRRMIFKIIHDSLLCSECIWEHIGGNEPVLAENIDHNHLLFLHTIFSGSNFFQVLEVLRPVWYLIFLFLTILTKLSMKTTKQVKPKEIYHHKIFIYQNCSMKKHIFKQTDQSFFFCLCKSNGSKSINW